MTVHNPVDADPQTLPAGRHGLTRAAVTDSQRGRILIAMAQSVAEKGYPAATVADVLARARVSRATFYALFADKADCYQHAYATATRVLADEIGAAAADEPDAAQALRASLRAYLTQLQQDRTLARAFIVEAHAAPPELRQERWAAHRGFAEHLQRLAGAAADQAGAPPPPGLAGTAAVGALLHIVCEALQTHPEADLTGLRVPLEAALGAMLIPSAGPL